MYVHTLLKSDAATELESGHLSAHVQGPPQSEAIVQVNAVVKVGGCCM